MREPVALFEGQINRKRVEDLMVLLGRVGAPRVVCIHSPGGTFEFFSIFGPAIARRGLITLAGTIQSAAVILYLLGQRRLAYPNATFFFHEVRAMVDPYLGGMITVSELGQIREMEERLRGAPREALEEWHRSMRAAQSWFLDFLAETTLVSRGLFLELMRAEVTLDARDARHYGIVHEIVDPVQWRD